MARMIGIFGFGGGFLLLSPNLRELVGHGIDGAAAAMNDYSPFSYVAAAIGIFALLTLFMHKAGRT